MYAVMEGDDFKSPLPLCTQHSPLVLIDTPAQVALYSPAHIALHSSSEIFFFEIGALTKTRFGKVAQVRSVVETFD